MFDTQEVVYARTSEGDCTKSLKLTGREELNYYIKINKAGKVVEYYTSDGTYQYSYSGTGLNIEDIDSAVQIATASTGNTITISCSGVSGGVSGGNTSSNTPTYLYSNTSHTLGDVLEVNGTTVFDTFDPAAFNSFPITVAYKVDESNHITEIYGAFKISNCNWSEESQSCTFPGNIYYLNALDSNAYYDNKTVIDTALGENKDCYSEYEGENYERYNCSSSSFSVNISKNGGMTLSDATNFCSVGSTSYCANFGYDW